MSHVLLVLTLLSPPGPDSVYGVVRDAMTGAPVAGVRVQSGIGGPSALSTLSGAYSLASFPSGSQSLSFSRAGYDSFQLRVTVSAGSGLHVDVDLQPLAQPLPPLEVAGTGSSSRLSPRIPLSSRDSLEIGLQHFRGDALWSDPLAANDDPLLAAAISSNPGALGSLPGAMHVHGGSGDQNLVLLDGLPVYGGMHLGGVAGLLNPDAIAEVDLHSAVPPASLGGRLSSAIDVHLLPPSEGPMQVAGAWDATSIRQMVQGSFARGHGSFLVSGRQSYRGVFAQDGDSWLSNGFHDLLARGSFSSAKEDLRFYLLQTGDRLSFPAIVTPSGQSESVGSAGPHNRFSSSSRTVGAIWAHSSPGGPTVKTRLWSASSRAAIGWLPVPAQVQVESELNDLGLSSELTVEGRAATQDIGVSVQRTQAAYAVASPTTEAQLQAAPVILSAFLQDRRMIGRFRTSTGLRATSGNAIDLALEPRLSVRYQFSSAVALSLGAARLHQYVQSMRNEESLLDHAFAAELPVPFTATGLAPARSDQLTAEVETRIGAFLTLRVDGYARRFSGLLVPAASSDAPFASNVPPLASGSAKGLEFHAKYSGPQLEARGAGGLAFTERDLGNREFIPTSLRSRWAAIGISRKFGDRSSVRVAATMSDGGSTSVLGSGLEWQSPGGIGASGEISGSPQEILGALDGARLPFYFRTDLGFTRTWHVVLARREGQLSTNFTLLNLFNRPNALGYVQSDSERRVLLLPSRSLIAQIGWSF